MLKIKRVYEPYEKKDGFRVLVDRLWPRGLSKQKAHVDFWMKDIGPSDKLRKWFGHKPERWEEFRKKYKAELKSKRDLLKQLKGLTRQHRKLTLIYGAKDHMRNQAVVIAALVK